MKAGITDVAVKAGVSVATVSRSFACPDLVSPKTRERVLKAADELNYSISRSATAMKTGQALRVALLISEDISSWFNANLFSGLDSVLHSAGYDISVFPIVTAQERKAFFEQLPVRRNADAVIVSSFAINPDEVPRLQSVRLPIVGVNTPSSEGYDATVGIDDRAGMRMITECVLRAGHTDIAFVRYRHAPEIPHSADLRQEGFEEACAVAGDAIRAHVVEYDEHLADPGEAVLDGVFTLEPRPTAVCCITDSVAMQLFFAMTRRRMSVPYDLSLTGFDDGLYAKESGLTTARQSPYDLGRSAAMKALALIRGDAVVQPHERVPARLVERSSVARLM